MGYLSDVDPQQTREWLEALQAVIEVGGFSTSALGNAISAADQERKLRLVVETARRVWGE